MPILCGERVNLSVYKQRSSGAMVRVAGRFHAAGVLTTTDAGFISVELGRLETPFAGPASFVEVVGTKITDDRMRAMGIVHLPSGEVDDEICNEAIMVAQTPALRHLFAPLEERSKSCELGKAEVYEQQVLPHTQDYWPRADQGEGSCPRVRDGRVFLEQGLSWGSDQQVLSSSQVHCHCLQLDAEIDVELDAHLSAAG